MQQELREMCVGALLDINLGQYQNWLTTVTDEVLAPVSEPVQNLIAQLIQSLQRQDDVLDVGAVQAYIQAIALMSDETLVQIITLVTGKNPIKE